MAGILAPLYRTGTQMLITMAHRNDITYLQVNFSNLHGTYNEAALFMIYWMGCNVIFDQTFTNMFYSL